jgi:hypothetical protein
MLCFCGVRAYADEQDELLEEIGVDTEGLNDNLPTVLMITLKKMICP